MRIFDYPQAAPLDGTEAVPLGQNGHQVQVSTGLLSQFVSAITMRAVSPLAAAAQGSALTALAAQLAAQQEAADSGAYLNAVKALAGNGPLTAALTIQAASCAILALVAAPVAGTQAYLGEAGRSGMFAWVTGDQSAMVTADPYQGLYVAPASDTTGASGAWMRLISDNVYIANWWGISALQNDNHLRFNSLLNPALTPPGACVKFKWKVPLAASVYAKRDDLTIEGFGVTSWMYPTADLACTAQFIGNNLTFRNFRIDSQGPIQFANADIALLVGLDSTLTVYSNWLVDGVTCRGTGIGVLVTASNVPTLEADCSNDFTVIARPTNIVIQNCDIVVDQQAVSVFGCMGVTVRDNLLTSTTATVDGEKLMGRTLGSEDVLWHNNRGGTNGNYAFRLDQMGRGLPNAANNATYTAYVGNKNVSWIGNRANGCEIGAFDLNNCQGICEVAGNKVSGSVTSTNARTAIQHPNGGDPTRPLVAGGIDTLIIRDNRFEGYSSGFISNDSEKKVLISNNYFLGNACTAAYPAQVPVFWEFSAFTWAEVSGNQFLLSSNTAVGIRCTGGANGKLRVAGNTFPEGAAYVVHQPGGAGPGQVQLSTGAYDERANGGISTDPTKPNYHANDNGIYAAGSFAAATA